MIKMKSTFKVLILFKSIVYLGSSLIYSNALLAAFADFNHDRLTDLFLITDHGQSFEIIFQQYHKFNHFRSNGLKCSFQNDELIAGIIPSDFTGNAIIDLILISTSSSLNYTVFNLRFLPGNTTHIDCNGLKNPPFAQVDSHPFLLDINGDMISDFLAQENGKYFVWIGNHQSNSFDKKSFPFNSFSSYEPMKHPHSNSFIDLNQDGVADIIINGQNSIQYWFAQKDGYHFISSQVSYPFLNKTSKLLIGQLALADINNDQIIDHLIPICSSTSCSIFGLNNFSNWEPILTDIKINFFRYIFIEFKEKQIYLPVTLRVGDLTNDGYPDLIAVMKKMNGIEKDYYTQIVLFENVPSKNNFLNRTFNPIVLEVNSVVFAKEKETPVLVTLFDLLENGKLDIIVNTASFVSGQLSLETPNLKIFKLKEKEELDTYFLKVLVSTVFCTNNSCYGEDYYILEKYQVPYGTNKPGPQVCYELLDNKGQLVKSCAGQLSQSAHFSLQMPYSLFGLGLYANYIESVTITVPSGNTSLIFKRIENQIVPDSQIVVIPNPLDKPRNWKIQFFLTPSEFIMNTLYTFTVICLLLTFVIAILHRREVRQDEPERQLFKGFWVNK